VKGGKLFLRPERVNLLASLETHSLFCSFSLLESWLGNRVTGFGRISAYYLGCYLLWKVFENYKSSADFWTTFFPGDQLCIYNAKMGLATIWATLKNNPVTLLGKLLERRFNARKNIRAIRIKIIFIDF
jgi:hypothetical protein